MDTGMLTNPAPSNGYDAVLAALQPHAAPKEGSLGGTTPSVHNRVKQTFINPVATYPFIARKWREGWEQSFHAGDLMFVFTGRGDEEETDAVHTRRHTLLANLPVLNHVMRMATVNPEYEKFSMVNSWQFIGIMRNSAAASGLHPGQNSKRGGNAITPDRIINIDVRGATRMFNYWASARAGGHLWLAWRELTFHGGTAPDKDTVMGHGPTTDGGNATDQTKCWQLLPYSDVAGAHVSASCRDYKKLNIWWSDQTVESREFQRPTCVGWVYQGLGRGELSDSSAAIRKATQLAESRFQLPMIHAFLHV